MTRLGLIGDVHAEHRRLDIALDFLARQGVDAVCCTGDIADGPGCVDTCCRLLAEAGALVVAGNHDRWLLTDRLRNMSGARRLSELSDVSHHFLQELPKTRILCTSRGDLLLCHGVLGNDLRKVWPGSERMPVQRSPELDAVIAEGRFAFVVNGHMHYRVLLNFERLTLVNAGTLKGEHRPGLSVLDFNEASASAFELNSGATFERVAEVALLPGDGRPVWRDTAQFDGSCRPITLYAA
jgi:predicted phosphodiesterase